MRRLTDLKGCSTGQTTNAFTDAITITGIAGAGIMVLTAIWALVMLRGAAARKPTE